MVYERVRAHLYRKMKHESDDDDPELSEDIIDAAMPGILQSFKNADLEGSVVQIKQKDMNVLENVSKQVEDMKDKANILRSLLSAGKSDRRRRQTA